VGVSKDTVARALRRPRHAGVVVAVVQDRTTAGEYGAGRYVTAVPAGITLPDPATAAPSTRSGPATRSDARRVVSQVTFVLDPEISGGAHDEPDLVRRNSRLNTHVPQS
jgi:hypothetical protein